MPGAVRSDSLATRRACRLFGPRHSEVVRVYERRCLQCAHALGYDGLSSGVLNWSDETLLCEELPRNYYNSFHLQRNKAADAYYSEISSAYRLAGSGKFLSKALFK